MPHPTTPAVVRHPDLPGVMVALDPAVDYPGDDALVVAYPALFAARTAEDYVVRESVEVATAVPGEKRSRSRK